jgi:hypothetical protein
MTESSNNQENPSSGAPEGQSATPEAGIPTPPLAPDTAASVDAAASDDIKLETSNAETPEIVRIAPAETAKNPGPPEVKPEPRRPGTNRAGVSPGESPRAGTALIVARPGVKPKGPPKPEPETATPRPAIGFRSLAAMVAVATALGGLAGSIATASIARYKAAPAPATPINYGKFTEGFSRIDRELATLKTGIDNATKASNQQVAKIVDRMDRAEKAQAEAGTKLAKASDVLDRVERRLASPPPSPPPSPAPQANDVTGAIGETRVAAAEPAAHSPSPLLPVDGWVLRDVYRGTALIQGHGTVIEVLPGDQLPGVGRIEQIKRQDGKWVVVTSRGLIMPH